MAKIVQLGEMSDTKLKEMLENNREEMFNLRFQQASARLKDMSQVKRVRRDAAQLETVLHNREQAIAAAATHPALADALRGQEWEATARFSYEETAWAVEFKDSTGRALGTALVNLNARYPSRRDARQGKTRQVVRSYQLNG